MWLTGHLTDDWLDGRAYYRDLFIDNTIDNPDQRIQQDIDIFTAGAGGTPNIPSNGTANTLLFGAVQRGGVGGVVRRDPVEPVGRARRLRRRVPARDVLDRCGLRADRDGVAFWLGRPLIWLSFNNEKLNAAFRYALVRLRDAAEAVGFYRGEQVERTQLWRRFTPIIDNYRRFVRRTIMFNGWNWSMTQAIVPLPWMIQAPRLFAGQIDFGDVSTDGDCVRQDPRLAVVLPQQLRRTSPPSVRRSSGCTDWSTPTTKGRELPAVLARPSEDGSVEFEGVEVRTPDGDPLVDPLDVRLEAGQSLVITGQSGAGKTTLLRSLAELWPYASGTLRCPDGDNATMFLSQLPYVPLGTLRAVVCYPNSPDDISDDDVARDADQGGARTAERPARRRAGLGQGAVAGRATAGRLRAHPADQTQGGLPRREPRRRSTRGWSTRCISCCAPNYRSASWSASATGPRSSSIHEQQLELLGGGPWRLGPVEKDGRRRSKRLPAACAPARRPKNDPSPSWVPLA